MSGDASIVLSVDVRAAPEQVFAAAVDWPGHGRWMLLTDVAPTRGAGDSVGDELRAVTGLRATCRRRGETGAQPAARVGMVDTMRIERWEPPRRAVVRHTGRVVRGAGEFAVVPRADGTSVFVWSERLSLPLGPLGGLAWPLIRPVARVALGLSLRRFARWAPTAVVGG